MGRWTGMLVTVAALAGCADQIDDEVDPAIEDHFEEQPFDPVLKDSVRTVEDVVRSGACSTEPLRVLDEQIAQELSCLAPGTMARIDDTPNLSRGGGVRGALQADAAVALRRAVAQIGGMSLNSGWRSVAQQYVLKRWEGSCGVRIAATPGNSNHESGLAIDTSDFDRSAVRNALRAAGFTWYCSARNGGRISGCADPVHFEYGGGRDLRGSAVRAFQRLWNRNHPEDRIAEDGGWGAQTAERVARAPVAGFARVAACGAPAPSGPRPIPPEPEAASPEPPPAPPEPAPMEAEPSPPERDPPTAPEPEEPSPPVESSPPP